MYTFEVNIICQNCDSIITGEPSASIVEAIISAKAEARAKGWREGPRDAQAEDTPWYCPDCLP